MGAVKHQATPELQPHPEHDTLGCLEPERFGTFRSEAVHPTTRACAGELRQSSNRSWRSAEGTTADGPWSASYVCAPFVVLANSIPTKVSSPITHPCADAARAA